MEWVLIAVVLIWIAAIKSRDRHSDWEQWIRDLFR